MDGLIFFRSSSEQISKSHLKKQNSQEREADWNTHVKMNIKKRLLTMSNDSIIETCADCEDLIKAYQPGGLIEKETGRIECVPDIFLLELELLKEEIKKRSIE